MIKAIVFDLDDTLISKRQYDRTCLRSVARFLSKRYNIAFADLFVAFLKEYDELNRTHVIDTVLRNYGIFSKALLKKSITVYRTTGARGCLHKDTMKILKKLKAMGLSLYLITDGKIEAQRQKILNSGLTTYFSDIIFTYSLGEKRKKPDSLAFRILLDRLAAKGREVMHVGDNPYRDFVEIGRLGIRTVRILRKDGQFKDVRLSKKYEANALTNNLYDVVRYIKKEVNRKRS